MPMMFDTGDCRQITASTLIKTGPGVFLNLFVSAASATPTIKVWDSTTNSGRVLLDVFTPTAPATYLLRHRFTVGLYVEISGTVSCTVGFI